MSRASSSATNAVEPERVARQRQPLERAVRGVQDGRRGRLVDLAALDADEAVLDVVDAADAMRAAERVQALDELDGREALAVERDRDAALEGDRDLDRGRRVGRRDGPLVGVGRRRDPRVLEDPGLARAAPQVDVDRVRAGLGDRDLDAALVGVVDLLVAGQAHPDAHRRDDLEPRIERVRRDIEADLVVALAGAAVGDRVGALALGDLDEELRDQRPGERGRERVGALVQRVGLEVRPHEVGHEPLAGIDDVGARRAGRHRPLLDALAQRAAAEVDGQRDHLGVVLLLEPGDGDGRIESARVGEDDLLHEYGTSADRVTVTLRPRWLRSGRASARGAPRRRRGPGAYCRPPGSPPALAAWICRSPARSRSRCRASRSARGSARSARS